MRANVVRTACAIGVASVLALACNHFRSGRREGHLERSSPSTQVVSVTANGDKTPGLNRISRDEVNVRLDGREIAVLRYGELPPGLTMVGAPDHAVARYFRVADYVKALGVPLADVRAVHFLGNRGRVASIEGSELRAKATKLVFDFTRTTEGAPAAMWDTRGLRNPKRIDFIRGVEIFVAKEPPAINTDAGCYASATSGCSEEEVSPPPHGVRVYVDGRIVSTLKRRDVSTTPNLAEVLTTQQIAVDSVRGVEIVASDVVVERAEGPLLAEWLRSINLESASHNHGRVLARSEASKYPVEAILLYRHASVPKRKAVEVADRAAVGVADITAVD